MPANATHILQPLHVAVFKPFKTVLKQYIGKYMKDEGTVTINKKAAIKIGSEAWRDGIMLKPDNIISGFRNCGLY